MKKRKIVYSALIFLMILAGILAGVIFYSRSQELRVIFLDVGQGDAILITRGNLQILIDGGPSDEKILEKLGEYVPFWDRQIEILVATHPDSDHIHGLTAILETYQVGKVLDNGQSADSQIFKKYEELIAEKKVSQSPATTGMKIKIGQDAELEIFHPETNFSPGKDSNAGSVAGKLVFGENSFLLTGDLPADKEAILVKNNSNLKSKVIKVAHHGSKYSTSEEFLEAVQPKTAVISVGKNNRYGHPSPEALERLRAKNINILRTDEVGDVVYNCQEMEKECVLEFN